jgi:menaquinone-dependent protoporphyrinogen oxidase
VTVLVSAASKHGATAEMAAFLATALTERGVEAAVAEPADVTALDGVDAVVLGSAVYVGHWLEPARALVDRLGDELRARPVWLFSSGPVGEPLRPVEDPVDVADLLEATGARDHRVFPGRIDRGLLGFGERAMVRALRVPEGDFRDWPAVEAWAAEIAAAVEPDLHRRPTA